MLQKIIHIVALAIAQGALIFLAISIIIAMVWGRGKILLDFNSVGEGWSEFVVTLFALVVLIIHTAKYISSRL